MNELIGKEVWVKEYGSIEFRDCNGVFSSRDKAEESVWEDANRCSDIWKDMSCVSEEDNFSCYEFEYCGPHGDAIEKIQGVSVYSTTIE